MKFLSPFALALIACSLLMPCAKTCSAQTATESTVPGLAIGKKAPDFILNDQSGSKQQLSKLLTKGPVAIVFHRSASW